MSSETVQSAVKPQKESTVVDMCTCKADLSVSKTAHCSECDAPTKLRSVLCKLFSFYAGNYTIHQDNFILFSNRGMREVKKVGDLRAFVSDSRRA
jgi:hypothetical protein